MIGANQTFEDQSDTSNLQCVNCCLCEGPQSKEIFISKDYNWGILGVFRYVKCNTCGLIYENPRPIPDRIMELYPHLYGTAVRNSSESPQSKINASEHHIRSGIIDRFISNTSRSIFDIGCGSGFFLEYMRRRSWRVSGIDPSAEHINYAKRYLGLQDVWEGLWPLDYELPTQADVVSLFHVIEHLLLPIEALTAIKQILRPEGIVVLETPNVESWPARLFGPRWVTLDAPRHVNLFSKRTLSYCLWKAGFEVLMPKTFSPSTMEYTESIRYLLQDLGLSQSRKRPHKSNEKIKSNTGKKRHDPHPEQNSMKTRLHKYENLVFRGLNAFSAIFESGYNLILVARKPSTPNDMEIQ
jgi:2-polyprenyl-3-methyl-5-hydroxy-6-metoxy-1,4-benzoquinol methylase